MHYENFRELAALYALDALSQAERDLVEAAIAEFPEWETELAALQATAAKLAYSVPDVSMTDGLKQRLFQQITDEFTSRSCQQDVSNTNVRSLPNSNFLTLLAL